VNLLCFFVQYRHGDGRYWNDEEQTQSVMKKDEHGTLWMHTGDEGIMDQEGYLQGKNSNQNQIWPIVDIPRKLLEGSRSVFCSSSCFDVISQIEI
jgi:acyl-CoA synthetase (AMP-forming)/AMP-acid ligase II